MLIYNIIQDSSIYIFRKVVSKWIYKNIRIWNYIYRGVDNIPNVHRWHAVGKHVGLFTYRRVRLSPEQRHLALDSDLSHCPSYVTSLHLEPAAQGQRVPTQLSHTPHPAARVQQIDKGSDWAHFFIFTSFLMMRAWTGGCLDFYTPLKNLYTSQLHILFWLLNFVK